MSPASSPRIVINADDLGRTESVNRAIAESFERGLITSASLMANMPAFDGAISLISDGALGERIGVHLNLTEGTSLTVPIRSFSKLCGPAGELKPRAANIWRLSADEARAIEAEYAAQIEAVVAAGIKPSHLDSHQHFHTQWPIGPIVIRLARRYGVPAIRLSRNCGPLPGLPKRIYKTVFNARLRRSGLVLTRHFGNASDAAMIDQFRGPVEIMVHPDLDRDKRVVDVLTGGGIDGAELLEPVAVRWREVGSLVSFRELSATSQTGPTVVQG
jgi:predicted glycoside hydrolase/deacetylase ChbG (UPF0249 family)